MGNSPLYDELSNEGVGTKVMGGGLFVPPPPKTRPSVVVDGGGKADELEKKLQKVTKERDKLKENNAALQKALSEMQKQVSHGLLSVCSDGTIL